MEKYIKASTVLKFINSCLEHEDKITDIEKVVLIGVKTCVERLSAEDVVSVVRCRECIFRDHYKELDGTKISICTGAMAYTCTPDDWYCANGKRKDGG